jgi:hypothetical protein
MKEPPRVDRLLTRLAHWPVIVACFAVGALASQAAVAIWTLRLLWSNGDQIVLWERSSPRHAATLITALALVAVSLAAYKMFSSLAYGALELTAAVSGLLVALSGSDARPNTPVIIIGALFLMVRGFDDTYKGIKQGCETVAASRKAAEWSMSARAKLKSQRDQIHAAKMGLQTMKVSLEHIEGAGSNGNTHDMLASELRDRLVGFEKQLSNVLVEQESLDDLYATLTGERPRS